MRIDAHAHLWDSLHGMVNGKPVTALYGGKSDFGGNLRQMMPPYMVDGKNTAEMFLANMDYARVHGAVITQEAIDGNQDEYLLKAKAIAPERFKICSLFEEGKETRLDGFDGVKIPAFRLKNNDLTLHMDLYREMDRRNMFLSLDLEDGASQCAMVREISEEFPDLRIAIGHFGMITVPGWEEQFKLARRDNVRVESGGITWLFHKEYYPYKGAVEAILRAADICGMEKLMWGSDYPRTMTAITYLQSLDFVEKSSLLSEEQKKMFLGDNAEKFYGFSHMDDLPYVVNMVE